MSSIKLFLTVITLSGAVGIGYGMWSIISPGEERRKELLKNLPESNPVRMEETRRRNALMLQVLKEAAETNDNVLARYSQK
ncbi:ubiquinol-cytochrome-c reductase complex assembly factor 3 [Conger conger]|uniref:ubiquinol-cytochrome-c reductase complex assembly factor 3 n=1 Tax=Conger conger TaxID=82655 RepID=UPI002A5ADFAE|nr:ubiquinol-cytochrome-c reductase complex assembly factor 3 [Conger conger]